METSSQKRWKVLELLNTTAEYFKEKQIENPRLNAEQLLGKALHLNRVAIYLAYERPVTDEELLEFRQFVKRRARHEPLQYIIGETEFMGLPFKTTPAVLIPRPETETLVEEVLKMRQEFGNQPATIVDIGCGSGCIPVSIARNWAESRVFAADISGEAMQVALRNSQLNSLAAKLLSDSRPTDGDDAETRLFFIQHDIFDRWPAVLPQKIDILTSNPPYISQEEIKSLPVEVRDFEPQAALTDYGDGLRFYRRLFELAASDQPPFCDYLFLEMSGLQPQRILNLAGDFSFSHIEAINDLNGFLRVLKIKVHD